MESVKSLWSKVKPGLIAAVILALAYGAYQHRNDHALLHQLVQIEVQRQQAQQRQQQAARPQPVAPVPSAEPKPAP